jgi:endonuclease/exonuclease/phosphatase family metal-dependent hydrolase
MDETSASWCTISPMEGDKDARLTITMQNNVSTTQRRAEIVIASEGLDSQHFVVEQAGATPYMALDVQDISSSFVGDTCSYHILSNATWRVKEPDETDESASWYTITPRTGEGNTPITIQIYANPTYDVRTASIQFESDGVPPAVVHLRQDAKPEEKYLTLSSSDDIACDAAGGSYSVSLSSNVEWQTTLTNVTPSFSPWCTVSPGQGVPAAEPRSISIEVAPNADLVPRSAIISFVGAGELAQSITVRQEGVVPSLQLSEKNINADPRGGTFVVNVTSNVPWQMGDIPSWCRISSSGMGINTSDLTITVAENTTTAIRKADIGITGEGLVAQSITVTQTGQAKVCSVSPSEIAMKSQGGSYQVEVTSNVGWRVAANGSGSWFSVTPSSGTASTTVTVKAEPNPANAARTASIQFESEVVPMPTVSLRQEAKPEEKYLNLSIPGLTVGPEADVHTFTIRSNTSWVIGSIPNWLSINSTKGQGEKEIRLTTLPNESTEGRSCLISIEGEGVEQQYFTFVQSGAVPYLTLNSSGKIEGGVEGGSYSVEVKANVPWTVEQTADWCQVTPKSGANADRLTVALSRNATTDSRQADILVKGKGVETQRIQVAQAGQEKVFNVSPSQISMGSQGGNSQVAVTSNIGWKATGNNSPWLTITPTSGNASSVVSVSVAPNTQFDSREGRFTITGANGVAYPVVIKQAALLRVLSVSPSIVNADANGGNYSVGIEANLPWTASSNVGWISVSPRSGGGNGTVAVKVDANQVMTSRSGSIIISASGMPDQKIQVEQKGKTYLYTLTVQSFNIRNENSDDKNERSWDRRRDAVVAMMRDRNPDLVGMQEVKYKQKKYLTDNLKNYAVIGKDRDMGYEDAPLGITLGMGEYTPIYQNRNGLVRYDWGVFWASNSPSRPSYSPNASCRRVITWGLFVHQASGKEFYFVSVHLDHSNDNVRQFEANVVMQQLKNDVNKRNLPMIVVGDFNTGSSSVLKAFTDAGLKNAREEAPVTDWSGTYNAWGAGGSIIDNVFYTPGAFTAVEYKVIKQAYNGVTYISDHYPIEVKFGF